jgi:hypothetical protein
MIRKGPWHASSVAVSLGLASAGAGGCDPVKDDAVAALGPEAPGVRQGPLHRPGQPCLLCHDGAIGDPQRFTVAGTVFQTNAATVGASGIMVDVIDAKGQSASLATNAAGNFYATPGAYDPTFPLQVTLRGNGLIVAMQTLVEGNGTIEPNGACASCHVDPAGPSSPGHVAMSLEDGGVPP